MSLTRGDFLRGTAAVGLTLAAGPTAFAATAPVRRLLYVATDGNVDVFDIGRGFARVKHLDLPQTVYGVRGMCASAASQALYISYGGNGGENGFGGMLALDLRTDRALWNRSYQPNGVDSPAVSPDGRWVYLPDGALSDAGRWYVIESRTGLARRFIHGGRGAHNTVLSRDGRRIYMGGRSHNELLVADTRTGGLLHRIGPLRSGVRPLAIDRRERFAFTTATGFLGFQVSSIASGKVLHTLDFPGFSLDPSFDISAPSHGISLSPDERTVWVMDSPNEFVHVFDVSKLPATPRMIASVKIGSMRAEEKPCRYACDKDGWVSHSRDGRYVFVGDGGDVIDTRTRKSIKTIDRLANTRKYLEIQFTRGRVSWAPAYR